MRHKSFLFNCISCAVRDDSDLADIPEDLVKELAASQTSNLYKKGQVVFYEGNRPFGLYCIHSGKVKLQKYTPEGKAMISRIAETGDLLGYRAFFTDESYSATAEALEDATICFLDKAVFFDVLKRDPNLSMKLLAKLGRDLKCAEDKVVDIAYKSSQERIIELLLTLKEAYGEDNGDGSFQLNIQFSREELANMIGLTKETVVRLLSWLKEKSIIETKGKNIRIVDMDSLIDLAPMY